MKLSHDHERYDEVSPQLQARLRGHYRQAYGPDADPAIRWSRLAAQLEARRPARERSWAAPLAGLRAWASRGVTRGLTPRFAALVLLLALGGLAVTLLGQPAPVSAEMILQQAQSASTTPLVENYHLTATMTGGKQPSAQVEEWSRSSGELRQELAIYDAQGNLVASEGVVENSAELWSYRTVDGQTRVIHHPIPEVKQRVKEEGAAPMNLEDLLGAYNRKCQSAEYQGEATIAGQPVHLIKLVPDLERCPIVKDASGGVKQGAEDGLGWTLLWLDQQTMVPLRWERYDSAGATQVSYEVTSIAYNVDLPESTFHYTPPEGAEIVVKADEGVKGK